MTTLEGRVIRRRRAIDPPPGVRNELEVLAELAERLGAPGAVDTDARGGLRRAARGASAGGRGRLLRAQLRAGSTPARRCSGRARRPPTARQPHPGTPRLFLDALPHAGRPRPVRRRRPPRPGRRPARRRARLPRHRPGARSTTSPARRPAGCPRSWRRAGAVRRAAPAPRGPARRRRRRAGPRDHRPRQPRWPRRADRRRCGPDTVFMPFHWAGPGSANLLTNDAPDPVSGMPEFKVCAVRHSTRRPAAEPAAGSVRRR